MSIRPQELNKIIADLRQIIVGKAAMPTDQIEQITLFLFLKQLSKKHDELVRIGSKELIFTGAWERYHFDVLARHSGEDLVKECREAVESLYKNPHIDPTVRKVFERSYLKILDPKVLSSFLIYLNDKFSDGLDLGDFYESLLPILGTQNELGQFRTPRHIIDFIIRVIDPGIGEKIADPACGTAGFLVSAFNYLKEKYTDKGKLTLNPEQTKQLYNDTIYGWDMEPLMVKFSLANLYLHGLKVPNVSENDTLLNENLWQHTFDIIVANPPFITPKGGAKRHSRFAIASNKTEVLFCEWIVNHLNFNGRMGIIVPEGIMFDASSGHKAVRKILLDNGLWCVVSLPQKVFNPYSPVKTSIVFLDKTLKSDQILYYDIENHGYSLNTNPTPINKNDLPNALEVVKNYRLNLQKGIQLLINETKYFTIKKVDVLKNITVNLSGRVHRNIITKHNNKWPMVKLGEVADLQNGFAFKSNDYVEHSNILNFRMSNIRPDASVDVDYNPKYLPESYYEKYKEFALHDGDVVIAMTDMAGEPKILGVPTIVETKGKKLLMNQRVGKFKDIKTDRLHIPYLKYILQSKKVKDYYKTLGGGGVQINIGKNHILSIEIPLPSIAIQKQIVTEIENNQKKIDEYKNNIELLNKGIEEKVKSIWES